jgi:hypothetical protein
MAIKNDITNDLLTIESELGSPFFTWKTNNYYFTPSIAEFRRELETGGYSVEKLLTATVRKLNASGSSVFTSYPTAQDLIIYNVDSETYRIQSVKHDPTGAYFRLIAVSNTRGV